MAKRTGATAKNTEFITRAARAYFACAWADGVDYAAPDEEVMNDMPDTIDSAASEAPEFLLADMLRRNDCADTAEMLARCPDEGDRPHTMETLGHYAAMQPMGHRVGLGDYNCLDIGYAGPIELEI